MIEDFTNIKKDRPEVESPKTVVVMIEKSKRYEPEDIEINKFDTVEWQNNDDEPHTVNWDEGEYLNAEIEPGAVHHVTFDKAGPHFYHCEYHEEMSGVVRVIEPLMDLS